MYKLIDLVFIFDLVKNILLCINDIEILNCISLNLSWLHMGFLYRPYKICIWIIFCYIKPTHLSCFFRSFWLHTLTLLSRLGKNFLEGFLKDFDGILWCYQLKADLMENSFSTMLFTSETFTFESKSSNRHASVKSSFACPNQYSLVTFVFIFKCFLETPRISELGRSELRGGGNGNPLSILAWKIPCGEEPGGLQSRASQGVGLNWASRV